MGSLYHSQDKMTVPNIFGDRRYIEGESGIRADVDATGNLNITGATSVSNFPAVQTVDFNGTQNVAFTSAQSVQFDSAQSVNATLIGTSTVQFPSAQSVQFDSTQNVSAVFPSAQDININGVTVEVGRSPTITKFDTSAAFTKGDTPTVTPTFTEATEYSTTTETPVEKKDWGTITYANYANAITTSLKVQVTAEVKMDDVVGNPQTRVEIYEDASPTGAFILKGTGGVYTTETSVLADITASSGTFGLKTFLWVVDSGSEQGEAFVKNQVMEIKQFLNETSMASGDFEGTVLYLKSISLPQDTTVIINGDTKNPLTNAGATTVTIDYSSSPILFTTILITEGTPSFVIVGAD